MFWRVIGELTGLDPESPYATKCTALTAAHVGLWDVLASSVRPGSLDSSIDMSTVIPNNFNKLLSEYSGIRVIGFNGNKSRDIFDKRVFAGLNISRIPELITLPSTSPAHASMPYEEKLQRWIALGKFLPVSKEPLTIRRRK